MGFWGFGVLGGKIGFTDINLAEYAGAGPSTQRYILQPYDQHHRLDNSILQVSLNITLKEGDTIFQRPLTRQPPIALPGEDPLHREGSTTPTVTADGVVIPPEAALSTGALTVPGSDLLRGSATSIPELNLGLGASSAGPSSLSQGPVVNMVVPPPGPSGASAPSSSEKHSLVKPLSLCAEGDDPSHTRNSSTTSHTGSAGYASSQGHSRQSSSGDSSTAHGRYVTLFTTDIYLAEYLILKFHIKFCS